MVKFTSDSFLPSGAIEEIRDFSGTRAGGHPMSPPKPDACSTLLPSLEFPFTARSSHSPPRPMSPPTSRSTSVDGDSGRSVEAWRQYANNLREQAQGERAHLISDRERMEELWDEERQIANSELAELMEEMDQLREENIRLTMEASEVGLLREENARLIRELAAARAGYPPHDIHGGSIDAITSGQSSHSLSPKTTPNPLASVSTGNSASGSIKGNAAKIVPQEKGRNPDGSSFWKPAPSRPSRTWSESDANDLRVEDTPAPGDNLLRINKELTTADFGVQSPEQQEESREGSMAGESIDISLISPQLEGVPIRSTAIIPTFVAQVLSPGSSTLSPSGKLSPNVLPPPRPREIANIQTSPPGSRPSTLEVMAVPENHRLVMNAGHTPTHSVHKFDLESGSITPTQVLHKLHHPSEVASSQQLYGVVDEDPELSGQLGLVNNPSEDDIFLEELDKKLLKVKNSRPSSPGQMSVISEDAVAIEVGPVDRKPTDNITSPGLSNASIGSPFADGDEDDEDDEIEPPKLRVKVSSNFGKPFGTL